MFRACTTNTHLSETEQPYYAQNKIWLTIWVSLWFLSSFPGYQTECNRNRRIKDGRKRLIQNNHNPRRKMMKQTWKTQRMAITCKGFLILSHVCLIFERLFIVFFIFKMKRERGEREERDWRDERKAYCLPEARRLCFSCLLSHSISVRNGPRHHRHLQNDITLELKYTWHINLTRQH